jgi:hypothetical protein
MAISIKTLYENIKNVSLLEKEEILAKKIEKLIDEKIEVDFIEHILEYGEQEFMDEINVDIRLYNLYDDILKQSILTQTRIKMYLYHIYNEKGWVLEYNSGSWDMYFIINKTVLKEVLRDINIKDVLE